MILITRFPCRTIAGRLLRHTKALGGTVELVIVPGKGHEEVDEYFKSDRLLEFLLNQLVNATIP